MLQAASQHGSSISQDAEKAAIELWSQSQGEVLWKDCARSPPSLPPHATPFVGQVVGYRSSRTLGQWFLTLQQSICLQAPGGESKWKIRVWRWKLTVCQDKGMEASFWKEAPRPASYAPLLYSCPSLQQLVLLCPFPNSTIKLQRLLHMPTYNQPQWLHSYIFTP